jgi:Tol biopolymer transport system component
MAADGTRVAKLTSFPVEVDRLTGAIFNCAWSPNGRRIVYSRQAFPKANEDGRTVVYVAEADGGNATVLALDGPALCPDWR